MLIEKGAPLNRFGTINMVRTSFPSRFWLQLRIPRRKGTVEWRTYRYPFYRRHRRSSWIRPEGHSRSIVERGAATWPRLPWRVSTPKCSCAGYKRTGLWTHTSISLGRPVQRGRSCGDVGEVLDRSCGQVVIKAVTLSSNEAQQPGGREKIPIW